MRGRGQWIVLAGASVILSLAGMLPADAQVDGTTTSTTAADSESTSTFTILPSTTSTLPDETSTSLFETTTTEETTTTTATQGPVVTLPRTTTTATLREPAGPVQMPTTTSTVPVEGGDEGLSAGTIVLLIITALLLIATVLGWATWRYWRATAPVAHRAPDTTFVGHG